MSYTYIQNNEHLSLIIRIVLTISQDSYDGLDGVIKFYEYSILIYTLLSIKSTYY